MRRRLGLRARITVTFALGAFGISLALSLITYGLTRRSVLSSHQASAIHQTVANAVVVASGLRSTSPDLFDLLNSLDTPTGSISLVYQKAGWETTNFAVGSQAVPSSLRASVIRHSQAATMRYRLGNHPELAVGVPLPNYQAAYFELYDYSDVSRTLDELALSLAAASIATTAGGIAIGRWASRRLLSPLAETARAAAAIAGGQLDTRVQAEDDPDLAALARSFNSMVSALQGRIQRDARFASDVSHGLRSPLTTLRTAVEVMEHRRQELPERSAQALDLLSDEVDRFGQLVEDLLEVSRFDAGAYDLALEELRPAELVAHALVSLGYPEVPLEVEPGAVDVVIEADKRRLERVLANLLANARAHGGGATRVGVGASPQGVTITVDDAGPGVPADQRQIIFERFARGRAAGRRARGDGVGLGLALVSEHVRLHQGKVEVTDSPDGGARFVVELPFEAPTPAAPTRRRGRRTGNRGLPRGLGEDPRSSRPPEAAAAISRASDIGSAAARGTTGSRVGDNLPEQ